MAKIFISYRRKSWAFTHRLADDLRARLDADIFVDIDSIDQTNFEHSIVNHLRKSDVVLLVVSETTFSDRIHRSDDWVRREIRETLERKIPLILVRVEGLLPPSDLPDDIKAVTGMQGVIFYPEYFFEGVEKLTNFVSRVTPIQRKSNQPTTVMPAKSSMQRWSRAQVALFLTIAILTLAMIAVLLSQNTPGNSTATPTTAAAVVQNATPTNTETATLTDTESLSVTPDKTNTPEPTLDIFFVVQTLDVQGTAAQRVTEIMATTQAMLDSTATATLWTNTPTETYTLTPNWTASIEAFYTERAATSTRQYVLDLTAAATLWTKTPIPSNTPSNTPTYTATLTDLEIASISVMRNDDWTPIERDFDGVMMVLVPVGCFMMGSMDGASDERPVERKCIDEPFWLDKYEVSNGQFESEGGISGRSGNWTGADRPSERITWFEARDYCEQKRGGRLPREKEWEYAARGPDNLIYPWGNEFVAANVVYYGNSNEQTADVGDRTGGASWVGALDLSGNVWEWVSSLYMAYPYDAGQTELLENNNNRVLRGGSWKDHDDNLRTANRANNDPTNQYDFVGFRCALSALP